MAAKPRNPLELPKGLNRRVDLPPEAYWVRPPSPVNLNIADHLQHEDRKDYTPFAVRPGYATKGTDIKVLVNQYRVKSVGNRDVFQYDVSLFHLPEPLHRQPC
jgi:eukaryotic translation initiation factor 2C